MGMSSSVLVGAGARPQVYSKMHKYCLLIPQEGLSDGLEASLKFIRLDIFM